ncbi:MAG TPA: hypothetical protein VFP93_01260 [Gammaproteobacteria bacterium]|nr:hypothetical protein [Gammaproteobacteria bacterium]
MIEFTSVSIDTALANLTDAVSAIKVLVSAISFIVGIFLVFKGVTGYKIFATQTFASAQKGEFAGPLVFIIVGSILIYLPAATDVSLFTVFGKNASGIPDEAKLIAYPGGGVEEKWTEIAVVLIKYMKLIGFIAFVRGWIILSKMGHSGSQPGSVGKGLTHLIGGVLLMNIVDTVLILARTFGFTT